MKSQVRQMGECDQNILQYLHISMLVPKSPTCSFASASKSVLAKEGPLAEIEDGLRQIFRMSLGKDGGQATNFLLCRVPWFESPYSSLKSVLLKIVSWQAGKGKSQASVCYNMVAEGLLSNGWQSAASTIASLAQTQRDCSVLFTCLRDNYPYKGRTVEIHLNYLKGLLQVARAHPPSRPHLLSIILQKLSSLDNETPGQQSQSFSPYPDEQHLLDSRDRMDPMASKLDCLLNVLLDFIDEQQSSMDDLLSIFSNQLLITDRLKSVQFVLFYSCQKNRQLSFKFMTQMLDRMSNPNSCKFKYLNNLDYLSSYMVHSPQVTTKMATAILKQAVCRHLKQALEHCQQLPDITKINLTDLFEQNQPLLQAIQILPYVCTYKPQLYYKLTSEIEEVLALAEKKCMFSMFVNQPIWERFVVSCRRQQIVEVKTHTHRLQYKAKFNIVILSHLGMRIDQIYRFSDLAPLDGKRRAAYGLEDRPTKKLKMEDVMSDQSTVLYRGSTPRREVF